LAPKSSKGNIVKSALTALLTVMLTANAVSAADWTGFRGPNSSGVSSSKGVPTTWDDSKNLKWKLELPGKGYSSPIVVGDSVYVTCYSEGDVSELKRFLVRIHRVTGKVVWSKPFEPTSPEKDIPRFAGRPGFASHTPVSDGTHIFAMFGNSGLHAFDLDGELLWTKEVGKEERSMFGSAASLVLHKDKVIVMAGAESESILAFNKKDGEQLWSADGGSLSRSYSTPVIATSADGRDELLVPVVGEIWSINPETGKLFWYSEARSDAATCPVIVTNNGVAYCLGGRSGGRTAIRLGGKGDVTDTHTEWKMTGGSYVPSPVIRGAHLYWVKDDGFLTCIDLATGKEQNRIRLGGKFYASITLIDDKLYAVSRFDGTHVLEATPELKKIAHNPAGDDSDHSASPAVSDGQLFIRSDKALYCIATE
jgi:outer membrane protein assembly factor BamB